jgi:hypothetical protein
MFTTNLKKNWNNERWNIGLPVNTLFILNKTAYCKLIPANCKLPLLLLSPPDKYPLD